MWSVGVHGRRSAFREEQRLLFAMTNGLDEEDSARRRQLMVELMTTQSCRGVVLDSLEEVETLRAVRFALQQACADNALLNRTHFAVVALTPTNCTLEEIPARVEQALATLQLQQLDMLLLEARSLPASSGLHERKRTVLEAWEHMMAIQQAGLVQHIGVCDLSVQDVEFLFTGSPANPPEAWSMQVQLPGATSPFSDVDGPLEDVTAFAHAHGIDVLARFPFTQLRTLEPPDLREDWDQLTQSLADRFQERPFKFLVAHENEGNAASYHMDSRAPRETTAMQTPLQIATRYLLQKGLVVVPQGFQALPRDEDEALRELFGPLSHPFTVLHPSCSPHKTYSSLLTRDDLAVIDRALPLTTSFPLPAPPRTPRSTTGRSRPGSTQERRMNLPAAVSRPPTAD